jgi:mannose-6-phosphate isomerase-like protein (cupin superfamily)
MDSDNPDRSDTNIVEMRWLLQRALGGSVVFFHEVTVPPGTTEGTHQHVGSEEVYYIVQGTGTAYMGVGDDPTTDPYPTIMRAIYDVGMRPCKELAVHPGSVIFTKSGGIHGIRNEGTVPLKFVAFLYHTQ